MHIQDLNDGSILLTAPVMIPGMPDCDFNRGEPPLTVEQIHDFAQSYERYQFVDSEHEFTRTGKHRGRKRESFILKADKSFELYDGTTKMYPSGTWMMTSHITDKEAIINAKKGKYTGYSPSVRSRETADKILELINQENYQEAEALKSQSLSGLIKDVPNPVVVSVSLVRKPCQTNSKICKIKNGENMSDESNFKTKILEAMGMSDAADVEALKSQVVSLEDKIEEIKTENAEALKSMKEEIVSEFKDALKEFSDKSEKPPEDEEEEKPPEDEEEEKPEDDEKKEKPEDDEKKEKPVEADKGSKQGKNHNGSDKSEVIEDVYTYMGRNPDGTSKR